MSDNGTQIRRWNEDSGQRWVDLEGHLDRQLAPLGEAALDALAPVAGERVLDLGCGTGATSLRLAERVGPGGLVVGVDVSRPMLTRARERTAEIGHVQILEADAQVAPLPAVDAAFSRFGVMFFADPVAAFQNVRAALPAGGRLAFVCWRRLEDNPVMGLAGEIVGRALGVSVTAAEPRAPGPFAFADEAWPREILDRAGFGDVTITPFDTRVPVTDHPANAARFLVQMGPAGTALREAGVDAARTTAIEGEVATALEPHVRDGVPWLPAAVWVVKARAV
ncbi:MAG: methyltransferase domain-containing protein [Myxococcales bacterium]|nr:methyltransferase domain-containing protein [Myxococcales bacterium]